MSLSTRNVPEVKGTVKTIEPGNQELKINSISLEKGFKEGSYNLNLNVETPPVGDGFEGFLVDQSDPNGDRYLGKVGRIAMSQYPFEDGETKTGRKVYRDVEIQRALINISKALNLSEEMNELEAETIEELVALANPLLSNTGYVNFCVAGRQYEKDGYVKHGLFLPYFIAGKGVPMELQDAEPSKLITFDPAVHIKIKKAAAPVDGFSPAVADDFSM